MIRPQLSADGLAVRLPLAEHVDPVLDDLALAYAQDPEAVGRLLAAHAASVVALDVAMCSEDATDYGRAVRAAEADATREALLDDCPAAVALDPLLAPDDAITLAGRITRAAAHIRHRTAPEGTTRP
ncbi:hypothetical protein C9F11_20040 [Streptomyces sp. YIM 121038]|uniref:hypothetical protein n=1 Tax=Streptomyces sp. YIM 121038 TaxID=2136401 RepID=UPI001110672A|nr:hypothetical protein [Streptomyces sp. YIM 121038]QCX77643.1 hypothetical protein C9F11_20040 [Streptomyces sp. YIM 121038]